MKKIIALMMVMMLVLCGTAMAENEINFDEVNQALADAGVAIDGQWVANEDWNAGFFLPSVFQEIEVPQDLADQGALAAYGTADGSAKFVVMYVELPDGATDAYTYCDTLLELGYSDAEVAVVNGYDMVTYTDTENDQLVAMSIYDDATAMVFAFIPASDEGFQAVAAIMMSSLLTYDEAVAMVQ